MKKNIMEIQGNVNIQIQLTKKWYANFKKKMYIRIMKCWLFDLGILFLNYVFIFLWSFFCVIHELPLELNSFKLHRLHQISQKKMKEKTKYA